MDAGGGLKKKAKTKATKARRGGGWSWETPAGLVFSGDERMSAVLDLHASKKHHRQDAARMFRLAALASERSESEKWAVYINSGSSLVIECLTSDGSERDRAVVLLVELLEGVS